MHAQPIDSEGSSSVDCSSRIWDMPGTREAFPTPIKTIQLDGDLSGNFNSMVPVLQGSL